MSESLFELTNQYFELANKLSELDLDKQTIADTIEASGIVDNMSVKIQSLELVAREVVAHHAAIDAEINRLEILKARRDKVAAGLHQYMLETMQRTGIPTIECPLFSISIRKNPPSVEITDALSLPAEYWRTPDPKPVVPQPDKAKIKEALQDGVDVIGARLTSSNRLEVK